MAKDDWSTAAFRRDLERVSGAVVGAALTTAVVAGAIVVQREAKANLRRNAAPDNATARRMGRAGTWRTGNLARSIHVGGHAALSELSSSSGGDIGGDIESRHLASVDVGTDVPYAARIEFGFAGQDSLGRTYSQSPQPYLRPAFDENQAEVFGEIRDVLAHQIKRALR